MSGSSGYQRFFAELKRRKVFRVAAVYGAVAFAALQGVDVVVPALRLPDTITTVVAVMLLVGFPIVLALAWVFETTPEGVRRTGDADPGELTRILSLPAARRWPAGVAALIGTALMVLGLWWVLGRPGAGSVRAESGAVVADRDSRTYTSIAVLPFDNLSDDAANQYFGDGLAEEILNTLSRIPGLRVAGRTSSFAFREEDRDLREIGDTLGVETILEGSVRRAGGRIRITAQLIDAKDGFHIWSDTYDRELTAANVFEIQDELSDAIAAALRPTLGEVPTPTALARTERGSVTEIAAYDHLPEARALINRRGQNELRAAIRLLERVVAANPAYAAAHASLAEAWALLPYYENVDWNASLDRAEAAARRALSLDSTSVEAYTALANVLRDHWEWAAADTAYRHALALGPENLETLAQYGQFLGQVSLLNEGAVWDDAARILTEVAARDPLSAPRQLFPAFAFAYAGRMQEAIAAVERALEIDPNFDLARSVQWEVLAAASALDSARAVAEAWTAEIANYHYPDSLPLWVIDALRDPTTRTDAIERLDQIREYNDIGWLITLYVWLDDPERALDRLETLMDAGAGNLGSMGWPTVREVLRDDPRFIAEIERAGLPYEPIRPLAPAQADDAGQ
jgi:TolB-like protein